MGGFFNGRKSAVPIVFPETKVLGTARWENSYGFFYRSSDIKPLEEVFQSPSIEQTAWAKQYEQRLHHPQKQPNSSVKVITKCDVNICTRVCVNTAKPEHWVCYPGEQNESISRHMLIHHLSPLFLIRSACASILPWEAVNIKAQRCTHTRPGSPALPWRYESPTSRW